MLQLTVEQRREAYNYLLDQLEGRDERFWLCTMLEEWAWGGLDSKGLIACFPELMQFAPNKEGKAGWFKHNDKHSRKMLVLKALLKLEEEDEDLL
jgi:hypothetical protein